MHHFIEFQEYIHQLTEWRIFILIILGFGATYFIFASLFYLLTYVIGPFLNLGRRIENRRSLKKGQIFQEIQRSLFSILIFAAYGVLIFYLDKNHVFKINWVFSWKMLTIDLLLLFFWNEIHFYCCHRLLHLPWFYRRVHVIHHKSVVPTPFSTFSLHWFEAILLSSLMLFCLPFYALSFAAIIIFPAISLILNNIGHMNYAILKSKTGCCHRHTHHHQKGNVNFGFFLPWLDKLFKTNH